MKKLLSVLCAITVLFGLQCCIYVENGDGLLPRGNASRIYDVKNFTAIKMVDAFHVHVSAGDTFSVTAGGELNDLEDLQVFVQNGTLVARYSKGWFGRRQRMDIAIVMPILTAAAFSGAVNADISGFLDLNRVDIELDGAARCDFEATTKTLVFDLSGASELNVFGGTRYLNGTLSGGSRLGGFDFPSEECALDLSGAGAANIRVTKLLNVQASGASVVRYRGDPIVQKRLSGASTLRQD
jgi:hypothetical protein